MRNLLIVVNHSLFKFKAFYGAVLVISLSVTAMADQLPIHDDDLPIKQVEIADSESPLDQLRRDPVGFMKTVPAKRNSNGKVVSPSIHYAENMRSIREHLPARDRIRRQLMGRKNGFEYELQKSKARLRPGAAAIARNDRSENLVDNSNSLLLKLEDMQRNSLMSAGLSVTPWSDSYWPTYRGFIGARYASPYYPTSLYFQDYLRFISAYPLINYVFDVNQVNTLSPSEKYDLLVNDVAGGLTQNVWSQARMYADPSGQVANWMGLCHGWAAASYMHERPLKTVSVIKQYRDAQGMTRPVHLQFYPSDIKALSTYLWSRNVNDTRFIGGRCAVQSPIANASGRILDQNCFDTNPGTWHLTVVNQIGVSRRSFIMDATYDLEVWNQPVIGYSYSYFNPKTLTVSRSLEEARVSIDRFRNDRFRDYRSSDARSVVGISMNVNYMVENGPFVSHYDGPQNDAMRTVNYQYDLELDKHGRIVGGEWYTYAHPDFLWTPRPKDRAESKFDRNLRGSWHPSTDLPQDWVTTAQQASRNGEVLAGIVEALINASRQ